MKASNEDWMPVRLYVPIYLRTLQDRRPSKRMWVKEGVNNTTTKNLSHEELGPKKRDALCGLHANRAGGLSIAWVALSPGRPSCQSVIHNAWGPLLIIARR